MFVLYNNFGTIQVMKYDQKIANKLAENNLDEQQAKILTYLYESGGAFPSRIAKETGVNRSTTYKKLTELSVQGLVSEVEKENKSYHQPKDPHQLVMQAKRGVRKAKRNVEDTKKLLPDLEGIYASSEDRPRVKYYQGKNEVVDMYMDHVNVDDSYEMLAWANAGKLREFMDRDRLRDWVEKKERIGITTRGIAPDSDVGFNEDVYDGVKKKIWPEIRFIPDQLFPYKGEITIYGEDRISIVNLKEDHYVGLIMEDKTIHDMMQLAFELSWVGANHIDELEER